MNSYGNQAYLNMQGDVINYDGEFNAMNMMDGKGKATMQMDGSV